MPKKSTYPKLSDNEIVFFQSQDGRIHMEVLYAEENIWLSQRAMAELFGCSTDNISLHLKNIYQEGELEEGTTTEESSVVQKEGDRNGKKLVFKNIPMKPELIQSLLADFESIRQETDGVKYWSARDLQKVLGYAKWENFQKLMSGEMRVEV